MKILIIIPARGGSKGIPRKNVRLMAGHPLISYAIRCAKASRYEPTVVVSTDDEEISNIAIRYGAEVIDRPAFLAGDHVTLDPVIHHAVLTYEEREGITYDLVITMQPTSPLLSTTTLDAAIEKLLSENLDTVLSGVNDPRLSWRVEDGACVPNYKERLNRQYMPKDLKETGAFVITKREYVTEKSRFGTKLSVFEMPERESGDIDTVGDWVLAETELNKKTILIRLDGYREIGMGHIYRGLLLAHNLMEHRIRFVLSSRSDTGLEKIKNSFYPFDVIEKDTDILPLIAEYHADIVINDILNTSADYMKALRTTDVRIVNLEDLGEGTAYADAVINDLYSSKTKINIGENCSYYWGSKYYLIKDEFLLSKPKAFSGEVKEVVVLFGGTDPANLTEKTVKALLPILDEYSTAEADSKKIVAPHVTIILGLGYNHADRIKELVTPYGETFTVVQDVKLMSDYMGKADLAIASHGRTMLELASMGVPTIIMSQNERETTHEFGSIANGFFDLGLGSRVEEQTLTDTIDYLMQVTQIRKSMHEQMLTTDLRHGMDRVRRILLGEAEY